MRDVYRTAAALAALLLAATAMSSPATAGDSRRSLSAPAWNGYAPPAARRTHRAADVPWTSGPGATFPERPDPTFALGGGG
jgi:hypothetical protein